MIFYVIIVTFQMTLMNKWAATIVMDDGWVSSIGQNHVFLLLATRHEILLWMIEIWMKSHLVSDSNCNIINLKFPPKNTWNDK